MTEAEGYKFATIGDCFLLSARKRLVDKDLKAMTRWSMAAWWPKFLLTVFSGWRVLVLWEKYRLPWGRRKDFTVMETVTVCG